MRSCLVAAARVGELEPTNLLCFLRFFFFRFCCDAGVRHSSPSPCGRMLHLAKLEASIICCALCCSPYLRASQLFFFLFFSFFFFFFWNFDGRSKRKPAPQQLACDHISRCASLLFASSLLLEMRILYLFTHSTDDPTTTTIAFLNAKGAVEAGHDVVMLGAGHAGSLRPPPHLERKGCSLS